MRGTSQTESHPARLHRLIWEALAQEVCRL